MLERPGCKAARETGQPPPLGRASDLLEHQWGHSVPTLLLRSHLPLQWLKRQMPPPSCSPDLLEEAVSTWCRSISTTLASIGERTVSMGHHM